jgi:hypothetical protein
MAIKGKSRSRGAKAVARGPKPAYVPVKKPLLARRGLWIGVAVALGLALAGGVAYGIAKEQTQTRGRELQEARSAAAADYGGALEPIIGTVGQPAPPANWSSFEGLSEALARLAAGDSPAGQIGKTATTAADTANTAWQALEDVDAVGIVRDRGLDEIFVVHVLDSKTAFVESLKLFEQGGRLVAMAAETEGAAREVLIERARAVIDVARTLFDDAYADYVEAKALAGIFEPPPLPAPGELPLPLTGPTGATGTTAATGAGATGPT